jgi:hypothetical protein
MTAQPIAPVIPSLTRRADRGHGRTSAARPLPVAAAPEIPAARMTCCTGSAGSRWPPTR